MSDNILEVEHLKQYFPIRTGFFETKPLKAVDDVSFSIKPGETLGLVGESGCGKTTVGRSIIRIYKPTDGKVTFDGEEITDKNILKMRRKMQMVFGLIQIRMANANIIKTTQPIFPTPLAKPVKMIPPAIGITPSFRSVVKVVTSSSKWSVTLKRVIPSTFLRSAEIASS